MTNETFDNLGRRVAKGIELLGTLLKKKVITFIRLLEGKVKRFFKGFLNTIYTKKTPLLCLITILILCISVYIKINYDSDKIEVSKNGTSILELEKRIAELEEQNIILKEELEEVRTGVENHRHTQYELIPYYQGKGNELQFERDTVWFENGTTTEKVEVGESMVGSAG